MSRVADIVEEKYLDRLPYILGAIGLLATAIALAALVYITRGQRPSGPPVTTTANIVVFESADCLRCDDFRKMIGKPHSTGSLGAKVPIKYFDVTDGQPPKRYKLNDEIGYTPTAVVFDVFGREVARVTGMPKSFDHFEAMLLPIAKRADRDVADAQRTGR